MKKLARAAGAAILLVCTTSAFAQNAPAPWSQAKSKSARCAALVRWYEATLKVAGAHAFSPNIHVDRLQKITARGFVDDVFVASIGTPYHSLTNRQRKSLSSDIGSCGMGPVDPMMRDYLQAAFSSDQRFSMVRDWPAAIAAAQRIEGDRASFRGGQSHGAAAAASLPNAFVPYFKAITKDQRCDALQKWYERGVVLSGSNTFGTVGVYSNDVMARFARAFVDDIFPIYFGGNYGDIQPAQGPQIQQDIVTCNTPAVGQWAQVVAAAFKWNRGNRDAWVTLIDAERNKLNQMRYDAVPERAMSGEVRPPQGKAPGPYDAANRDYSRIIYSDNKITVGVRDRISRKCQMNIGYAVGIDLARNERITPTIAKDMMDKVLLPLAQRECPGTDLTIDANVYFRTLSVTHKGEIVPVGSVEITGETELAVVSYGPGHRAQKAAPTMYYGGINKNWPELASFDGIVDYEQRGSRNRTMAVQNSPKRALSYVNYTPSETPASLKGLKNGRLIQQMATRDFFGIYRDGFIIDSSAFRNSGLDGLSKLFSHLAGGLELDPLSDTMTPRRRVFVWTVQAYSEYCRKSLGNNPAVYRGGAYVKVGETEVNGLWNKIVTEHWRWQWDDPVYMDPAYYDVYVERFRTEKAILARELMKLRGTLSLEQLFAGEAMTRPYEVVMGMKADAASYFQTVGCESGKQLLRNWAEFIQGPLTPIRADGRYPMIVERIDDDRMNVSVGDVPASIAPAFPYTDGIWLTVNYYGNRTGGLKGYEASHFNLLYLGKEADVLMKPENSQLLKSFQTDRLRVLSCFYDQGTANYWLKGFAQPNERQRNAVGPNFRGSAAQCPSRWPG